MSPKTRTLGLISAPVVNNWGRKERILGYEMRRLIQAGRSIYGSVILINPLLVTVELPRGREAPRLTHDGGPMPEIDSLIVRSIYKLGDGLSATVRCLALQGCDILDPVNRGGRSSGSKLPTSIKRFTAGVGSSTFLAFGRSGAGDLLKLLVDEERFPLIAKPVAGRGGKGIERLDTPEDLARYVRDFYRKKEKATLLLQTFEEFSNEFRVITFFGKPLGIIRKIPAEGAVAANAAQGGIFERTGRPDVIEYVAENVDHVGILGVDVGELASGGFRIIEANRAPNWQAFDRALDMDTAAEIVTLARGRLEED